jgi:hypothetical protein
MDKYCIFFYSTKSTTNTFQLGIGTNRTISLSFNKYGKMINQNYSPKRKNQLECPNNKSNLLNIHTKLTDYVPNQTENQYMPIFTNKNTNSNLKSYYQNNKLLKKSVKSNYLTSSTSTFTTKTKLTKQLIRKKLSSPPAVISLLKRNYNYNDQSSNNKIKIKSNHIRKLNKKRLYNYYSNNKNNDSNYLHINHHLHQQQQQPINNFRKIFN